MALSPEDIIEIKKLMFDHDNAPEKHSWSKFFKGFFTGQNYVKAIVFGFCLFVVLLLGYSTYSFVKSKFAKPMAPAVAQTQTIGTNQGQVNTQTESHDNRDENAGFNIINLSNWFKSKK